MKKAFCFDYFSMSQSESKFFHVWFEFFPSYLSRKKEISETFLGLGLRTRHQKTFPRFPFFYFGNLGKTQIRRGKILLQTWHGKKSKQNTIFRFKISAKFCVKVWVLHPYLWKAWVLKYPLHLYLRGPYPSSHRAIINWASVNICHRFFYSKCKSIVWAKPVSGFT